VADHQQQRSRADASLTKRELDVLSLMADGLTNRQIAGALGIALGTVKTQTSSILTKLGARNRTEAALMSLEIVGASDPEADDG
jgi:DNA-binding NarL/FixJ family response regulator